MIVTSAMVQCDKCGIKANHPTLYWPEGWVIKWYCPDMPNGLEHICEHCADTMGLDNILLVQPASR